MHPVQACTVLVHPCGGRHHSCCPCCFCLSCERRTRRVVALWVGFDASWSLRIFLKSPKNTGPGTPLASQAVLPSVESASPLMLYGARRFCTRIVYSSLFMATLCDSSPHLRECPSLHEARNEYMVEACLDLRVSHSSGSRSLDTHPVVLRGAAWEFGGHLQPWEAGD